MKNSKVKTVFRGIFLAALILEVIVLCVEALLPGNESSATSSAVGDVIDGFMTDLSGDGIRDVAPEEVEIRVREKIKKKISLDVGNRTSLALTYTPDDTSVNYRQAKWSSSDPTVATIERGVVEALSPGETVITAELTSAHLTAQLTVEVSEVIAEEFELFFEDGAKAKELDMGQTVFLGHAFPDSDPSFPAVTYESTDETVVTVTDDGAVKAISAGSAEIVATYTPKTEGAERLTDRVHVEVSDTVFRRVPLESLYIRPDYETLHFDEETGVYYLFRDEAGAFLVDLMPTDTTDTALLFFSDRPDVLSVDGEGNFTARSKGTARIRVISASDERTRTEMELEVRNRSLGYGFTIDGAEANADGGAFLLTLEAGTQGVYLCPDPPEGIYLRYRSDNERCAEVYENGLLFAKRASEDPVTITVEISDNAEFRSGGGDLTESYTLRLTVEKQSFSGTVSNWGRLIRKLFGHFGAFLAVGITAAVCAILFDDKHWKRRILFLLSLIVFGFTLACLTEFFQLDLFTSGRGAAFSDVVIDCLGYHSAAIAVYGVFLLVVLIIDLVKLIMRHRRAAHPHEDP